jgi:hypothetical protein
MSNFKKVIHKEQLLEILIKYDDDMRRVDLSIITKKSMTPDDFMDYLIEFVDNVNEFPQRLFVESNEDDLNLH